MCRWRGWSVAWDCRGTPCSRGRNAPRYWWDGKCSTCHWCSSGGLGTSSRWGRRNRTPTAPVGSKKRWSFWGVHQGRIWKCYLTLKALILLLLFKVSYNSEVLAATISSPFRQYLKQNSCYEKALFLSHPVLFTPDPHIACSNEILDHFNSVLWSYSEVVPKQEESKDFFLLLSKYKSSHHCHSHVYWWVGESVWT